MLRLGVYPYTPYISSRYYKIRLAYKPFTFKHFPFLQYLSETNYLKTSSSNSQLDELQLQPSSVLPSYLEEEEMF